MKPLYVVALDDTPGMLAPRARALGMGATDLTSAPCDGMPSPTRASMRATPRSQGTAGVSRGLTTTATVRLP